MDSNQTDPAQVQVAASVNTNEEMPPNVEMVSDTLTLANETTPLRNESAGEISQTVVAAIETELNNLPSTGQQSLLPSDLAIHDSDAEQQVDNGSGNP